MINETALNVLMYISMALCLVAFLIIIFDKRMRKPKKTL